MPRSPYLPIPDSDRTPRAGASVVGPANLSEPLTVTVYLRRDPAAPAPPDLLEFALTPPAKRKPADHGEVDRAYRAAPADITAVKAFALDHGLTLGTVNEPARSVQLTGTVEQISNAFQVTLARYRYQGRDSRWHTYRGREGAVHVPAELEGIVTGVLGLDNRPIGADLRTRQATAARTTIPAVAGARIPAGTFLPTELGRHYSFPAGTTGAGQCIAVLAFNGMTQPGRPSGGYSLDALRNYFVNVLGNPMPDITDVVVAGPGNDLGSDDGSDPADSTPEIMLDLAMVGGLAPGAKIVVYFTVFTEQGWVDAIHTIVTDTVNKPTVISCSYGNPEDSANSAWTRMAITSADQAFAQAGARNISICCASGDDGTRDDANDLKAHADFPASSPHVLGVGGTSLVANTGGIASETVWDQGPGFATGGGVSRWFPVPPWQSGAHVPHSANPPHSAGRGVPDVAADADLVTGVVIPAVDGQGLYPIGGTSAAAPLWAALLSRVNEGLSAPVGFLNPLLYTKLSTGILRDITQGSNGAYDAGPGWDACTGFGSPVGTALLSGLKAL
ncbi:protease pro-enzyme activation domain-containing protein [Kitasatospora sp. NPDC057904]|uniref:S53 family peptidase n=1 Tax=unclassified Kitasatospora TaxID=2633591 RepID=UPI0036DABF33